MKHLLKPVALRAFKNEFCNKSLVISYILRNKSNVSKFCKIALIRAKMGYTRDMDRISKVNRTAIFVQEFFQGAGPSGSVGVELIEPLNLPIWMKDAAHYGRFVCRSPMGETTVTLIMPKDSTTFEQVANLYRVFTRMGSGPALILADDLPPKARGVLVRMSIPHVVTGSAIYAPQLGLAYGKIKDKPMEYVVSETLSSVGLKLTAAYLLQSDFFSDSPSLSEIQQRLVKQGDYSVSVATLSRAFQQLQELELVVVSGHGPQKRMRFLERQETWARLFKVSIETVVRRVEARYLPSNEWNYVFSGDSALGKLSDLMEPHAPTIAMSVSEYRKLKEDRRPKNGGEKNSPVTEWGEAPCIIELWREDPCFLSEKKCLNVVELVLSLRSHTDERVQIALAQLLEIHGLSAEPLREKRQGAYHG